MSEALAAFVGVALAIVGLAFVAVIVSKNANTSGVVQSIGSAFGGAIQAALGPVSNNGTFGAAV